MNRNQRIIEAKNTLKAFEDGCYMYNGEIIEIKDGELLPYEWGSLLLHF